MDFSESYFSIYKISDVCILLFFPSLYLYLFLLFGCNQQKNREIIDGSSNLHWEDCEEEINMVSLANKEPILFFDEVDHFALQ